MRNKLLALLVGCLILTGCATTTTANKPTPITVPPTYSENIPMPTIEPVTTLPLEWRLLNKERAAKIISEMGSSDDFLLYTLDEANMSKLIGNIQELRRYIESQRAKIEYLVDVINARKNKGKDEPLPDSGASK
jgi:hypothetical protein